ncbi:hypothetical protein B0H13DRAFT_1904260 [Mycena leptocephala]|nr:hypothetical protein B0H13DRAFT_1904260 [Mycena leptocephala]
MRDGAWVLFGALNANADPALMFIDNQYEIGILWEVELSAHRDWEHTWDPDSEWMPGRVGFPANLGMNWVDKLPNADLPSAWPRECLCAKVSNPVPNEPKSGTVTGVWGSGTYMHGILECTRSKHTRANVLRIIRRVASVCLLRSPREVSLKRGGWKWDLREKL